MVFSSAIFLFAFLPVVLAAYFMSPARFRNVVLLLFSLLFYTWGENIIVAVMLLSTTIDYSCGLLIENGKRKTGLYISIFSNLSLLGFFKYFNFTTDNFAYLLDLLHCNSARLEALPEILLPIGISFYTFQSLSYTIDVYRGHVRANRNFIDFATYVTMFPQLVAGPIVRYYDINRQLVSRNVSLQNIHLGVERFILGLAKKVLVANTFAFIADDIFARNPGDLSSATAWIGALAYTIQIYFDFSGYSDMAIGLGKIFGFNFLENFNYPYISKSIREFWRRWHISLSTWFRDYLYIPLGGNRLNSFRTYLNLVIVFFVTGLWHGASWNFVIWGLYHGAFLILERVGFGKRLRSTAPVLQHTYALLVVIVGWVLFRADDLPYALDFIGRMFSFQSGDLALNSYLYFIHINPHTLFFFLFALIFSGPVFRHINDFAERRNLFYVRILVVTLLFALCLVYISADSYNPFIYFRF